MRRGTLPLLAPALLASAQSMAVAQRVDLGAHLPALGLAPTVSSFQLSPDGARAFLVAGVSADPALCSVPLAKPSALVRLSPPGLALVDPDFRVTAGGDTVVFRVRRAGETIHRLLAASASGAAPARELPLPGGTGDLAAFELEPSGPHVLLHHGVLNHEHLYAVLLDGSAPPVELNAPLAPTSEVRDFRVAPRGGRVVYRADHLRNAWYEIFSVPLDRSSAPVRINTGLALHGDVHEYAITPDGLTVVYVAEQNATDQLDLFARAIDGSGLPRQLSPVPVAGGDVHDMVITPDGTRALFLGDLLVDEATELWSVPIDASSSAARLSGPMAAGGDVREFALDADGRRVVYRADEIRAGQVELFGASVDGRVPAARLNGALGAGQVLLFELGDPLRRVLYGADAVAPGRLELFSAPSLRSPVPAKLLGAGATDVSLAPTLELAADAVPPCAFARDGRIAVFRARRGSGAPVGLWVVPSGGGEKPGLLDGSPSGDVREFRVTPDGTRVVYRGELLRAGEVGLYAQSLARY